jgi:hypothetical protein
LKDKIKEMEKYNAELINEIDMLKKIEKENTKDTIKKNEEKIKRKNNEEREKIIEN